MIKRKRWTNDEESVIISMRAEGKTIKEIAIALGRTKGATTVKISKMIDQCKLEKRGDNTLRIDFDKVGKYVSENPGNISEAFRKYAKDYNCSVKSVHTAYYTGWGNKTRVKDRGTLFTVVGKKGHTTNNGKNTNHQKRSNLWNKLKEWLFSSLLS